MLREEWRLHSRLFGSRGFAGFPLFVILVASATYGLLVYSGFAVPEIQTGLHYFVAFLGLNVGSLGFVSRDAAQNLLEESELLVFSSRTLPVSQRRAVATFVVKDLIYYSLLYLTPIVAAFVPVIALTGGGTSSYLGLPLLWLSTSLAFLVGTSVSFLGATLSLRGRPYLLGFLGVLAVLVAVFRGDLLAVTPLAFHAAPSPATFLAAIAPVLVLVGVGVAAFSTDGRGQTRTYGERYRTLADVLWFDENGLVARMLFDVTRSSGGVWKVGFSVGVLFGVYVFLVTQVPVATVLADGAPGVAVATLLAISSISVYHWLNRFDRPEEYLVFPVDRGDVLRAKFRAELVVSLPLSYLFLGIGGVLFGVDALLVGAVLLPALTVYVFGVTVYLTGLDPHELLMDTQLFAVLLVAVAAMAVPLFVAAIVAIRFPLEATAFAVVYGAVAGAVGLFAYRRAVPRWRGEE
jgi:hypothetical protein